MNTDISERQLTEIEDLGNYVFSRKMVGVKLVVRFERMEKT